MNRPQVVLQQNHVADERAISLLQKTGSASSNDGKFGRNKRGGRIKSFILRGAVSALILTLVFLPRIFPYKGSETVTDTVKTVIMTDITGSKSVGEGKLVEIFRKLFAKDNVGVSGSDTASEG